MDYDFTKLDAVIDGCLNEFGSMSLKRLNRVGKALEKKILKGKVVDIDDFEKMNGHVARVKSYVHRVQPRAKAFRKKVSGSVGAAELSAFIDQGLNEFGSGGQARLVRVAKGMKSRAVNAADLKKFNRQLRKLKWRRNDGANRALKRAGKIVPRYDPRSHVV